MDYSVFDIIGPRMIGPSSSHTAGAARLGKVARRISGNDVAKVTFVLYGSFAKTYKGHGTDRALLAGIMDMEPNDPDLGKSMDFAKATGLDYEFVVNDADPPHPNTVKMVVTSSSGKITEVVGCSIGGGNIRVIQINGLNVEFTGEYPTLVIRHFDRPGVIAEVTSLMVQFNINIAFMRVFRQSKGQDAFMIIETDNNIPKKVISQVRALGDEIQDVYLVEAL
ncbi:MAG TPA: L-serine ammonia-lyase, iron-sulfur-dependent subunit beta [Clostridia bacterium]|nr:L-serine ammonia-lyase, iron-sulfur-dependent subunit beta [Clostridia bacterium]